MVVVVVVVDLRMTSFFFCLILFNHVINLIAEILRRLEKCWDS